MPRADELTSLGYTPAIQTQAQQQQNDPSYILNQLMNPANAPNFQQEAQQQISQIFGPQLQAITNQQSQAKGTAKGQDAQLAAMYRALGLDIGKNANVIKGNY